MNGEKKLETKWKRRKNVKKSMVVWVSIRFQGQFVCFSFIFCQYCIMCVLYRKPEMQIQYINAQNSLKKCLFLFAILHTRYNYSLRCFHFPSKCMIIFGFFFLRKVFVPSWVSDTYFFLPHSIFGYCVAHKATTNESCIIITILLYIIYV